MKGWKNLFEFPMRSAGRYKYAIELGVATQQATLLNWQSLNAQTNSVLHRVAQTSKNLSHDILCTLSYHQVPRFETKI